MFARHCSVAVMLAEVTEVTHMQTIEINPSNWGSFSHCHQVCTLFLTSHTWYSNPFVRDCVLRNCLVVDPLTPNLSANKTDANHSICEVLNNTVLDKSMPWCSRSTLLLALNLLKVRLPRCGSWRRRTFC